MLSIAPDYILIGKIAGATTAIGVAASAGYRTIIRPLRRIYHEITPNGGSSIKDSMNFAVAELKRQTRDITALQLAVNRVAEIQRIANSDARCGIMEANGDGEVIGVNQTICRITGRTAEELRGNNWVNIIHPADRPVILTEWNGAVRHSRDCESRFRVKHLDGREFWVAFAARIIRDPDASAGGWLMIFNKVPEN